MAAWLPTWVQTVQAMIDGGIEVRAWCERHCRRFHFVVDLERVKAAKGADYSLINKRTKCKTSGCDGWVRFHYPQGVYRRLWDDETAVRWMVADRRRIARTKKGGPEGPPAPSNL